MIICPAATKRVLVDGGANRWLFFCDQLDADERVDLRPADWLTGDFDSVTDATRAIFAASGTQIIPTTDQDHTDFTKALIELKPHMQAAHVRDPTVRLDKPPC